MWLCKLGIHSYETLYEEEDEYFVYSDVVCCRCKKRIVKKRLKIDYSMLDSFNGFGGFGRI